MNTPLSADVLIDRLPDILKHGVEALPNEAVGLICPDGTIVFLTNEAEGEGAYLVSGEQLEAAFVQENGVCELGFGLTDVVIWHTHPSGYIGPSRGDLKSRRQPLLEDIAHLVVSLPKGEFQYY